MLGFPPEKHRLSYLISYPDSSSRRRRFLRSVGEVSCNICSLEANNCKEKKHFCVIRPEHIKISRNGVKAKIVNRYFHGASWAYKVYLRDELPLFNITNCKLEFKKNEEIMIDAECKNILIFQE